MMRQHHSPSALALFFPAVLVGCNQAGQLGPSLETAQPHGPTMTTTKTAPHEHYGSPLPPPYSAAFDPSFPVPTDQECKEHWERFGMLNNVVEHSLIVADIAGFLAERAVEAGLNVDVQTVRASALLHDIAKTYCIRHGGNHSQLGGAWTMELTGNPIIASGVTHHVYWPFEMDLARFFTPLAVIYADKRVNHSELVSIKERFADLIKRYGIPLGLQDRIKATEEQALDLEHILSDTLKVDLDGCTFDSGRLV